MVTQICIDKIAGCIVPRCRTERRVNVWLNTVVAEMPPIYLGPISHLPAHHHAKPIRNTSAMSEAPPPPSAVKSLYKQAQLHIPTALSAPSWLRSYEDFVMKNATQVTQIESALRSISYIIPGMFAS